MEYVHIGFYIIIQTRGSNLVIAGLIKGVLQVRSSIKTWCCTKIVKQRTLQEWGARPQVRTSRELLCTFTILYDWMKAMCIIQLVLKVELDWSPDKLQTYFGMQKCGETDWAMSSTCNKISDNTMHPSSHFQTKIYIMKFCRSSKIESMLTAKQDELFTLNCELFN